MSSAISTARLQLVLTQQTRDDSHSLRNRVGKQGGCNKGPAAVTSLPNTSSKACARRQEALGARTAGGTEVGVGNRVPCQVPVRGRADRVGLEVAFWSLNFGVSSVFFLPSSLPSLAKSSSS